MPLALRSVCWQCWCSLLPKRTRLLRCFIIPGHLSIVEILLKSKNANSDLPSPQFSSTFLFLKALKCEAVCAFSALLPGRKGHVPVPLCRHSVPSASCWWPSAASLATASPSKYLPVESRAGWDFLSAWKVLTSH